MSDTPLTPAEAAVLLKPNLGNGAAAVKATLLFLLVTGVLRMETIEEPGVFRRRKVARLKIAAAPKNPPPEVAALVELVRATEAEGGRVKDVAKRAQKAFGAGCPQFSAKFILPALVARGLLTENKILFFKTFRLTPEGMRSKAGVNLELAKADEIARLAQSDPRQAAALARTLGVQALLSDKLTKQFKPLADAMRRASVGGDSASGDGIASYSGGDFDFSHFDFAGFDLGHFDAGAMDAIHTRFDSFDASFSDGGHGGGHDGGGGHH